MTTPYTFSLGRARMVRFTALVFMLIGLGSLIGSICLLFRPAFSVQCSLVECVDRTSIVDLAPESERHALKGSAPARATFAAYVARPLVRAELATVRVIDAAPFAILMIAVGLALRQLGARRGNDLARALPWLRRGAVMAVLMVVATPLSNSLNAMALYPGTPSGPMWDFEVELHSLVFQLLLALAAFSIVWALDAGSRAERDMAEFI